MGQNDERRAMTGVALSWSKLILAAAINLVILGALYADLRNTTNENTRRIQTIEERNERELERWQEFREDVKQRLQRIEDKIEMKQSLGELK